MNDRLRELTRAIKAGGKSTAKFVLPSALSVVVTFFVATHLKPILTVSVADGEVVTLQLKSQPNKLRTALVDWSDEDGPRIVSASDLTFRSAKDFTPRSDRGRAWISKFIIGNDGWATANHITIGIGIPTGAQVLKVVASPNIAILSDNLVQTSATYPPYRKIEIGRLGKSEQAVLTILSACSCGSAARPKTAGPELFIPTDKSTRHYSPVLFLSSEEGTGRALDPMDIKNALALEKDLFPSTTSGYWSSSIDVAKNSAAPKIEPVSQMKMTLSADDEDGKKHEFSLTFP